MIEYGIILPNREANLYAGIERVGLGHAKELSKTGTVHLFAHRYTDLTNKNITLHKLPEDDTQAVSFISQQVKAMHTQGRLNVAIQEWERPDLTTSLLETGVPLINTLQCHVYPTLTIEGSENVVYTALTEAHKTYLKSKVPGAKIEAIGSGIDLEDVPFSSQSLTKSEEEPKLPLLQYLKSRGLDYLTIVGAIGDHKGTRSAVEIAHKAGLPLVIIGAPGQADSQNFRDELAYYKQYVEPISESGLIYHPGYISKENVGLHGPYMKQSPGWELFNPRRSILDQNYDDPIVYFYGLANNTQKYEALRFATANLRCSTMETKSTESPYFEAYGLTSIEGPITGTPTVGYTDPSWTELVINGVTGFSFESINDAVGIIKSINENGFDRGRCADAAREKYDSRHAGRKLIHVANEAITLFGA